MDLQLAMCLKEYLATHMNCPVPVNSNSYPVYVHTIISQSLTPFTYNSLSCETHKGYK